MRPNKTKIVCTIGPASKSPEVLEQLIEAGMNVARINFSHGAFDEHKKTITAIRNAASKTGCSVSIMADLPGPKMRIGTLHEDPLALREGDTFTLSTDPEAGGVNRTSVTFERLDMVVKPGDILFLNDGLIQLRVNFIKGHDVVCTVTAGGELRARKGLNLPDIDLGISAFTPHDHDCLQFAAEQGIDAVSQSFVESADDVRAVRNAADALGYHPFIIAKIERSRALGHLNEIIAAADGIMVARGDLGVEIPIEQIAVAQKRITSEANIVGKPVITATQMLESMVSSPRPTRAESTDVANAILDGTDCVMLSEESAMGAYPVEAVRMLAKIASSAENARSMHFLKNVMKERCTGENANLADLIAVTVETINECVMPAAIFVPTHSGHTARSITRFRLPVWVIAVSSLQQTCRNLQFSYGVHAVYEPESPDNWTIYARKLLPSFGIEGKFALLIEGPSTKRPETNNRVEIFALSAGNPPAGVK